MLEIMEQVKWTVTNHAKLHNSIFPKLFIFLSKEGMVVFHPKKVMCIWWDWKGVLYLWAPSGKSNDYFQQVLLPVRPTEGSIWWKASRIIQQKTHNLQWIIQDCMFLWWPGRNCCSLAERLWFICLIHQTLHLQISICFHLYKILLWKSFQFPERW